MDGRGASTKGRSSQREGYMNIYPLVESQGRVSIGVRCESRCARCFACLHPSFLVKYNMAHDLPKTLKRACVCVCSPLCTRSELKQQSEAAEKATISQAKDMPPQNQPSAELGGLSEAEKKRLVAQYDCESDGDSEYPISIYTLCIP